MIDFAGSGVVHVTGGFCALLATKILGARKGRFYDRRGELLEEPKAFPGHSRALQVNVMICLSLFLCCKPFFLICVEDDGNLHIMVWLVWIQRRECCSP